MKVYEYRDYEHYMEQQTLANTNKIHNIWISREAHSHFCKHYRKFRKDPASILCHGSRNGAEVRWFGNEFPNAEVLGTDISYTATDFPNQVQWDMQKENPEWIAKWDLIYTNSLDHVTDFIGTLEVICNQLSDDGLFILDYTIWDDVTIKPSISDPLDVSLDEIKNGLAFAGLELIQTNWYRRNEELDMKSYYFICRRTMEI